MPAWSSLSRTKCHAHKAHTNTPYIYKRSRYMSAYLCAHSLFVCALIPPPRKESHVQES